MARKYDASRREEAARKTREAILDAAFKLHGLGIVDYESLAQEANVSVATIRKHFPTREHLFEGCTAWGMTHYLAFPDLDVIGSIEDADERIRALVKGVHGLFDSGFGQFWGTYKHQDESAVMTRILDEIEDYQATFVDVALQPWPGSLIKDAEARGVVRGLLSFLTYYALVSEGGLTPEHASSRIAEALINALKATSRRSRREAANV